MQEIDRYIVLEDGEDDVGEGFPEEESDPSRARELWERQPKEPTLWYERFWTYVLLGPTRNIRSSFRVQGRLEGRQSVDDKMPGASWFRAARNWRWEYRAALFDDNERKEFAKYEGQRRQQARIKRLDAIERVFAGTISAFNTLDLNSLTRDELLPRLDTIARILDMSLKHHRLEFGEATEILRSDTPQVNSDDMAKARQAIANYREARAIEAAELEQFNDWKETGGVYVERESEELSEGGGGDDDPGDA